MIWKNELIKRIDKLGLCIDLVNFETFMVQNSDEKGLTAGLLEHVAHGTQSIVHSAHVVAELAVVLVLLIHRSILSVPLGLHVTLHEGIASVGRGWVEVWIVVWVVVWIVVWIGLVHLSPVGVEGKHFNLILYKISEEIKYKLILKGFWGFGEIGRAHV